MNKKRADLYPSHLIGRPALIESQDELFASETEMRSAISALVRYLKKSSPSGREGNTDVLNLMLQELRVEFSSEVSSLRIRADYGECVYVIRAPIILGESAERQNEREREILATFLPTIGESQIRATVQLYRTLNSSARKKLIDRYGVKEKKTHGRSR